MSTVDPASYCIDFVRASRAKNPADAAEANLTFYAQSRDAVGYAVIGNAYAPTTPLTTTQLKDIWECTDHGLERGRRPGWSDPPLQAAGLGRHADVLPAGDRQQPDQRCSRLRGSSDRAPGPAERRHVDGWRPARNPSLRGDEVGGADQRGAGHPRSSRWRAHRHGQHCDGARPSTTTLGGDAVPGAQPGLHHGREHVLRTDLLQRGAQRRAPGV